MLCSAGIGAVAQATDENPSVLRLSGGIETEDTTTLFTDADLNIRRATRSQQFQFSINTRLMEVTEDDSDFGIIDPRVDLSYAQQSGPLDFNVGYTYASADVDGQSVLLDGENGLDEDSFIVSTGTRVRQNGSVGIAFGERNPFGARVNLTYGDVSYEDTTDARLYDSTVRGADVSLRFDITRVFSVNAGLGQSTDDREDALNSIEKRRNASLGMTASINKAARLDASVNWNDIDTTTDDGAGNRVTSTQDGLGFDLGVTIDQRSGQSRFAYSRTVDVGGSDDRLTYRRSMELTKTQSLNYTVGAIKQDSDISFLGSVNFQQELRNGLISLQAGQDGFVTDDGARAISRRVNGSYRTDLTPRSSLSVAASLASLNYDDPIEEDGSSVSASVTYQHDLTRDWSVSASVRHTRTKEGADTDSDTGLTVRLNRDITLFR